LIRSTLFFSLFLFVRAEDTEHLVSKVMVDDLFAKFVKVNNKYIYLLTQLQDMKLADYLHKSDKHERYPDVFREVGKRSHRPQKRFKLIIDDKENAKKASKAGIPILWIDSSYTKMLRYPMKIPDTIVVPREYEGVIESELKVHTFDSTDPFPTDSVIPQFEDVIVFMLEFDPLAARAMVDRNELDYGYLQDRIIQEGLEREASKVYLQDHLSFRVMETPLDRERLLKVVDRNKIREVVP